MHIMFINYMWSQIGGLIGTIDHLSLLQKMIPPGTHYYAWFILQVSFKKYYESTDKNFSEFRRTIESFTNEVTQLKSII